jgi:negative regulator of flagellin synthesis FlgM
MTSIDTKVNGYAADTTGVGKQESVVPSRIKGTEGSPIQGGGTRGVDPVRGVAAARAAVAKTPDAPADDVHITESARQLLGLQQAIAEVPDVNAKRVEELRSAIEQQRYSVNSAKIADRLLQLEGDLQATDQSKQY